VHGRSSRARAIILSMGRFVAGAAAVVALAAFAAAPACHLAETPDPITCPAGSHPDLGRCVQDDAAATVITIGLDDAGACVVSPDVVAVASTGEFQFKNDDSVDHVVQGVDGQTWATVAARQSSPFIGIMKVGHWDYDVSGCAQGGTVDIQ
jgi:hypothetical protein